MPVVPPDPTTIKGLTMSALDYIKQALRANNVLASGEEPDGNETVDCLNVLNQMMDGWNSEELMIYTIRIDGCPTLGDSTTFAFTPNTQTYTLGSGGTWNLARPARIDRISVVLLNNSAQPLEIPIDYYTEQDWQENVPLKLVASTFPLLVYDDGSFPLRNLSFWPIPQVANNARIYSWSPLSYFVDTATKYSFPPSYAEAIAMNLAVALGANGFGQPTQLTVAKALSSLAKIKGNNRPTDVLRCEDAVTAKRDAVGSHNYRSELFGIP